MAFAIDCSAWVELRRSWDAGLSFLLRGVEVNYFLFVMFEGKEDRVGGEDGEVGMEFLLTTLGRKARKDYVWRSANIYELQLIDCAANAVGEEQDISL